jgi:hypothetical protein
MAQDQQAMTLDTLVTVIGQPASHPPEGFKRAKKSKLLGTIRCTLSGFLRDRGHTGLQPLPRCN